MGRITRTVNRAVGLGEDPGQQKGVCQWWCWGWWRARGHAKGPDFEYNLGRSLALALALMESQEGRREHTMPDMAARLPTVPPEPSSRMERRWRLSSKPSFPEKLLSLFVLAPPSPSHALLQLPSSRPQDQGRTRKSPMPSLSHFS